jgi:hypothetical protein
MTTMTTINSHTAFLFKTLNTYWSCGRIDIKDSENVKSEELFLANVKINGEPPVMSWAEVQAKMNELRPQDTLKKLREQRDEKLKQTDQYGLADYPFKSDEHKQAWLDYRQQLRDLPANSPDVSIDLNTGELIGVTWPVPPSN